MSFAIRLRELRLARGLSREELAGLAGLGRGTVRDYEQGHREPTLKSAIRLAEALGVSVDEFRNDAPGEAGKGKAPKKGKGPKRRGGKKAT
jgi:putative transcriptional regulator